MRKYAFLLVLALGLSTAAQAKAGLITYVDEPITLTELVRLQYEHVSRQAPPGGPVFVPLPPSALDLVPQPGTVLGLLPPPGSVVGLTPPPGAVVGLTPPPGSALALTPPPGSIVALVPPSGISTPPPAGHHLALR